MAGKGTTDDINGRLVFFCGSIVAAPESEKGFVEISHLLKAAEAEQWGAWHNLTMNQRLGQVVFRNVR